MDDEYTDDEKDAHFELLQRAVQVFEKKLPVTEDFMNECYELALAYYAHFIDSPRQATISDPVYIQIMNHANELVKTLIEPPLYLAEFYKFSKLVLSLVDRLEELEKENELISMMSTLSVKTKTRKLKK